tara:strand:+ start:979 stop:1167 length:189 start_codon:yes stop_codon:yes gene_type:complete
MSKNKIKRLGESKLMYDNGKYIEAPIFKFYQKIAMWIAIIVASLFILYLLLPYIIIFKALFS